MDIAIYNSFILHKELFKINQEPIETKLLTHKTFREQLAKEMLEFAEGTEATTSTTPPPPITCMPAFFDSKTRVRKHCKRCHDAGTPRVKTSVFCRKCKVPLCLSSKKNSFQLWHDECNAQQCKKFAFYRNTSRNYFCIVLFHVGKSGPFGPIIQLLCVVILHNTSCKIIYTVLPKVFTPPPPPLQLEQLQLFSIFILVHSDGVELCHVGGPLKLFVLKCLLHVIRMVRRPVTHILTF